MDYRKEDMPEKYLPLYLQKDIEAFQAGIKNKSSLLDCLYCELQSSINTAFYGNQITQKEADYLREKYLGLKREQ